VWEPWNHQGCDPYSTSWLLLLRRWLHFILTWMWLVPWWRQGPLLCTSRQGVLNVRFWRITYYLQYYCYQPAEYCSAGRLLAGGTMRALVSATRSSSIKPKLISELNYIKLHKLRFSAAVFTPDVRLYFVNYWSGCAPDGERKAKVTWHSIFLSS